MTEIDLEAAINYVRPVAESATVGMYGTMLKTVLDAATRLREAEAAIEATEDWVTAHYLDTHMGEKVLELLSRYETIKTEEEP